jgi:SPP1 family phage portal protein
VEVRRVEFTDRLSVEQIAATIDSYKTSDDYKSAVAAERYVKGDNPYIMDRNAPDENAPDNKVPVSYARKIINTTVGYMYKPGLIRYASDDEDYMTRLQDVFDANREPIKSSQLGKQTSTHGVGYEFHYVGKVVDVGGAKVLPRFAMLPVTEVIPLYDWEIEPELKAAIRFFQKGDGQKVYVYYPKVWEEYDLRTDSGKSKLDFVGSGTHPYTMVPLNVYANNDERIGDFAPIVKLIDAYDVLMSDSMNEFDRFAFAYLLLKGFGLTDEQAQDIKWKRAFERLDSEDAVSFLTKEIPSEYIKMMIDLVRLEIHNQSGIPDISDVHFGAAASGTTIDKFIYLMELFTDPKEAMFREGLINRLKIMTPVMSLTEGAATDYHGVEITMTRNLPVDDLRNADTLNKYSGFVSTKTLLSNFAPFVKDVQAEMDAMNEEKMVNVETFGNPAAAAANAEDEEEGEDEPAGMEVDEEVPNEVE